MYAIINITGLTEKLAPIDKLVLLVSCIGHDIDHPGNNNAYEINARTDLAVLYSDVSPLENHHCGKKVVSNNNLPAMLFVILQNSATNIFSQIPPDVYRPIRKGIIQCILATDMAKHGEIMGGFRKVCDNFNFAEAEHKSLVSRPHL